MFDIRCWFSPQKYYLTEQNSNKSTLSSIGQQRRKKKYNTKNPCNIYIEMRKWYSMRRNKWAQSSQPGIFVWWERQRGRVCVCVCLRGELDTERAYIYQSNEKKTENKKKKCTHRKVEIYKCRGTKSHRIIHAHTPFIYVHACRHHTTKEKKNEKYKTIYIWTMNVWKYSGIYLRLKHLMFSIQHKVAP